MNETQKSKKYFMRRDAQLDVAYQQILPMWRDLADYYLPRTCRFLISDANKKPVFSKKIVDSSTGIATRNFASGMMSGATNPAHKWFKTGIKNYKNKNDYAVKTWNADLTELYRAIFNASNIYNCLPNNYLQLGVFAISVLAIEKDYDNVINCKVLPIGSYKIGKDSRGVVNTLYRSISTTVGNLVDTYGIENVSDTVRVQYEQGQYESPIEIVHAVEPNHFYDKKSKFSDKKKFISVYYEKNNNADEYKFLERKGFNHFPYAVFEANVNGEDIYPTECPGIISYPDVKQLMMMIKEYHKALKKIVSPPLKGPSKYKNAKIVDAPSSFTATDDTGNNKLESIYDVNPQVLSIQNSIDNLKQIIGQIFYNDLFAMLTNSDFTQPRTATELNMRKEEALVLLSPLLQQVHSGLKQIMDIVFEICFEVGILPEPPEQIQGLDVDIEFISTLAQAQKAAVIGAMERFTTFVGNIAATVEPTAKMKINWFEVIDDYADFANIEPDNLLSNDVVNAQIAAMQKAQQQQQQMAALQQGSEIIKNMGGSDASGGDLMERIGLQ